MRKCVIIYILYYILGEFGTVYKARYRNQFVAVKVLKGK